MISVTIWRIVLIAVFFGHFGLMLSLYNRINGVGMARRTVKRIVKVMFLYTILLPPIVWWLNQQALSDRWMGQVAVIRGDGDASLPLALIGYGIVCLAAYVVLGIPWLIFRPIFGLEWVKVKKKSEVVSVDRVCNVPLALTKKCKIESRLPLNQLFELSIDTIELPVVGLPLALDGYKIAQLSDIHLTGDVHPDFARYAVQRATAWGPDLMAITGDIIDKQSCIDWLGDIFGAAEATDGCYYVLGNHDTRVVDSWQTREAMDRAGWTDLGSRSLRTNLRGVPTLMIGNEHPWYERPVIQQKGEEEFRFLVSHSPDQIGWARRHDVQLMLAGHTHGGQGRLPLAGPLLSPSYHGSRFASGDFFKPPTTMHVSRGLCGTHLLRINCRPELSLLVLRRAGGPG
ncbi:putative metallophosphoesterase [Rubripirellula obstinata]|uniref:Putative metallophosphoesterase n=1 Tax=Rubripirellula obstinata TaxID=406547 RepID=A0A5B1CP95_9BACT|nr:metallophosphoesterase [Rubripirellula obstinata]KAA1262071.1 putative metallophosphoesterase [Rubripirellula obstinata]